MIERLSTPRPPGAPRRVLDSILTGLLALAAALAVFVLAQRAMAEEIVDRSQYGADEWEAIVDQALASDAPLPTLIGGTVVNPLDWQSSPWVGNCSSTLWSDRVLKTAAHCVGNGGSKTFEIGGQRYSATCTHHPSYRGNSTADWALCVTSVPVVGVDFFETVGTAAEIDCKVGKTFTLTGYGCTRWGGGIDGKMRVGTAEIISCPSGTNYDIVTRANVALCSGDSGGGGYTSSSTASRKNASVNSRSNTTTTSYMPSYGVQTFRDWAVNWANAKGVKICGLHADAEKCRGRDDPDPDPADCKPKLFAYEQLKAEAEAAFQELKACLVQ